jgi:hypothetical protein
MRLMVKLKIFLPVHLDELILAIGGKTGLLTAKMQFWKTADSGLISNFEMWGVKKALGGSVRSAEAQQSPTP